MTAVTASIIIPTHDRDREMVEAVNSALGQSLEDIEVIVIDDACTDHTSEILDIYQKYDERLRVIRLPFALGISGGLQRSEGVKVARGKYICYLDDDDVMTPWAVEKRVEVLDARPELDFCWGRTLFIRNSVTDWTHLVYERLVAEPRFDVDWRVGTIIPNEFMHRAGVVGAESGIWWTAGRGEDQRLLAAITAAGYRGAPVDVLTSVYGRGEGFHETRTADKARKARLLREEKERLDEVEVIHPEQLERPQPAPARQPMSFSARLQARNARRLREVQAPAEKAELPPRVMQAEADGTSVPELRGDDDPTEDGAATEVEVR